MSIIFRGGVGRYTAHVGAPSQSFGLKTAGYADEEIWRVAIAVGRWDRVRTDRDRVSNEFWEG